MSAKQPNIVFFYWDNFGWGELGCCGGGVLRGFVGNGGILAVVVGVLWAIFGLFAGALYGLWAGRGVSARRLKGVGPLLPPDSSMILAWADGAATGRTAGALAAADTDTLILRFTPAAHGALLEV